MAHQHRLTVQILKLRDVPAHRRIQIDLALLRQLQNRQRRKGLGDRSQSKDRVPVDGQPLLHIPIAKKQLLGGTVLFDQRHRHTGGFVVFHDLMDI